MREIYKYKFKEFCSSAKVNYILPLRKTGILSLNCATSASIISPGPRRDSLPISRPHSPSQKITKGPNIRSHLLNTGAGELLQSKHKSTILIFVNKRINSKYSNSII